MFGFFDSFKRGCGCGLGLITGIVVALIVVAVLTSTCEITTVMHDFHGAN